MKNTLITSTVIVALLFGLTAPLAMAQETSTEDVAEESTDRRGRLQELRQRQLEARENFRDRLQGVQDNGNRRLAATMVQNGFRVALTRLTNAIERLDERMENLAERGIDTSNAEVFVTEASSKLLEAETLISEAQTEIEELRTNDIVGEREQEMKNTVKTNLRTAHNLIKEAHELLKSAIEDLRSQINGGETDESETTTEGEETEEGSTDDSTSEEVEEETEEESTS